MGATFSRVKTWVAEVLTPAELNAEFDNVLVNLIPAGIDDASINATAHQEVSDPYPGDVETLPTSTEGEIQQLRYMIKEITGEDEWFKDPSSSISAIVSGAWDIKTKTSSYTLVSDDAIILASASGGAMTITLPAAATASAGKIYGVKKIDTSTNAVTFDADGSENIDGFPSIYLRHQYEWILLITDQSAWYVLSQSQMRKIPEHRNLEIQNKTGALTTTVTVTADALDVEGVNGQVYRLNTVSEDIVITASEANGLDVGAEAGNTTYAIWVIFNLNTNTVSAMFSTSFSAPTMPSGYTFKRLVGYVRNDSGSDLLEFYQHNELLLFDSPLDGTIVLNQQSDVAWTDIDCSDFAGETTISKYVILSCEGDLVGAADPTLNATVSIRPNGSAGSGRRILRLKQQSAADEHTVYSSAEVTIKLDSNLIFEYVLSDANIDMVFWVSGVTLSL